MFCVRAGGCGGSRRGRGRLEGERGRAKRVGDAGGGCELSRGCRGEVEKAGQKEGGVGQPANFKFSNELSIKRYDLQTYDASEQEGVLDTHSFLH